MVLKPRGDGFWRVELIDELESQDDSKPLTTRHQMVVGIILRNYPNGLPHGTVNIAGLTLKVHDGWPAELQRRDVPKPHPQPPTRNTVVRALRAARMIKPIN